MEDTLSGGGGFLQTVVGALTLRDEVYRAPRTAPNPFQRGLVFVLVVSLAVALAGVVGAALTWWTSPDMGALKTAITEGVMEMPWQQQVPPEVRPEMQRAMEQNMAFVWQILDAVVPSVPRAMANVIFGPLGMLLFWLIYGLLAYLCARLLSGTATLAQTYGATALAAAPALLGIVHFLPNVQTAGLTTWAIVCSFLALKNVHELSSGRAFWATLISLGLLVLIPVIIGASVAAMVVLSFMAVGGMGR